MFCGSPDDLYVGSVCGTVCSRMKFRQKQRSHLIVGCAEESPRRYGLWQNEADAHVPVFPWDDIR